MSILKPKYNELNCFSPPVMIATFIAEVCLAAFVFFRMKSSTTQKLGVWILVLLGSFQLAEYMVCTGPVSNQLLWSRFGYIAITMLPPVGVHFAAILSKQSYRQLTTLSYALGASLALFFGLVPTSINSAVCNGNYVIFHLTNAVASYSYGFYYWSLLFVAIIMAMRITGKNKPAARWFATGYLFFIVPTIVINFFRSETLIGIPSIMCGFALVYAIILTFRVLPLAKK